jgi:hypothetical protein
VRIERLGEALSIVDRAWPAASFSSPAPDTGWTTSPLRCRRYRLRRAQCWSGAAAAIVSLAARQADIVSVMPRMRTASRSGPTDLAEATADGFRRKIQLVQDAAGSGSSGLSSR